LDDGIGDTFVSADATMVVTLPFPSTLRTAREFPAQRTAILLFEQLSNGRWEIL
jgi:hypothetical protein